VLLALGATRWRANEHDPRSTFVEALELARGLSSSGRLARAVLGAGGRFYAPGDTDDPCVGLLEEALAALEPGDSVLRVRLLAGLAEKLVFAQPPGRAEEFAAEAIAMARRLGEASGLAAALMGRHAALLHAAHTQERLLAGTEGAPVFIQQTPIDQVQPVVVGPGSLADHTLASKTEAFGDRAASGIEHPALDSHAV